MFFEGYMYYLCVHKEICGALSKNTEKQHRKREPPPPPPGAFVFNETGWGSCTKRHLMA